MRISLNLATRPFVELRPLFARLRLAMGLLLLVAVGLFFVARSLNAKANAATARMDRLVGETTSVQQGRGRNEARMRQPENQAVLQRSTFLNALFARKSFSWTAVMMDLERVLPAGVQVTSIDPVIAKDGEVSIRLRVVGEREKAIQLVRNLEHSSRFVRARVANETAVTADKAKALGVSATLVGGTGGGGAGAGGLNAGQQLTSGVEFEIFSGYNPLPAAVAAEAKEDVKSGKREKPSPDDNTVGAAAPGNEPVVRHERRSRGQAAAGGAR